MNASLDKTSNNQSTAAKTSGSDSVKIVELDKKAEYVVIKNVSSNTIDITGWVIVSVRGNQRFTFPQYSLEPNATVKVGDSGSNSDVDFHWLDGRGTWNNSESDPAELYDSKGTLIDRYDD
ncbi:MAG: lamin tail domain-containing protein [Candidatus Metalachnospira sp.]|nr:lamin tail domain-containing protein [Candidatus Metalachnospira sp.]